MEGVKSVLLYVLGAGVLILASVWFTRGSQEYALPTATPTPRPATATATRPPTATLPPEMADMACPPTPGDVAYGYIPNAPLTSTLAPPGVEGERLIITGQVYGADCETPLPGAMVEVWHAGSDGEYDRSEPYTLRGRMETDGQGRYEFSTVKPGHYRSGTWPRPAHIHYQITFEDVTLATRLMFADDPYLGDAYETGADALIITLAEESGPDGPVLHGTFNIYLPVKVPTPAPTATPEERL